MAQWSIRLLSNFNEEKCTGSVTSSKWHFILKCSSVVNGVLKKFWMITLSLKIEQKRLPCSKWVKPCAWTLHLPSPNTWIKFVTPLSGLYPNKTIMSFPTTVAVCPVTPTGLSTGFLKRVHCLNVTLKVHVSLETTPFLQVPPNRIKQFWNQKYRLKLSASYSFW